MVGLPFSRCLRSGLGHPLAVGMVAWELRAQRRHQMELRCYGRQAPTLVVAG